MPRKREGTRIGRGNGAGSQNTQFKSGKPSGNPNGRPRKPKLAPSNSLAEAARKVLSEEVTVQLGDGRTARMSRYDANMKKLMIEFGTATFKEKLAFMRMFGGTNMVAEAVPIGPSQETIMSIVEQLAEEARREEENRARYSQYER